MEDLHQRTTVFNLKYIWRFDFEIIAACQYVPILVTIHRNISRCIVLQYEIMCCFILCSYEKVSSNIIIQGFGTFSKKNYKSCTNNLPCWRFNLTVLKQNVSLVAQVNYSPTFLGVGINKKGLLVRNFVVEGMEIFLFIVIRHNDED